MLRGTAPQNIGTMSGLPKANVWWLRLNTESNSTGLAFHPVYKIEYFSGQNVTPASNIIYMH